jgi:TonB family protein
VDNGMAARRTIRRSIAGLLIPLIIVMFCLTAWKWPSVMAQDTAAAGKNDCNDVDHPHALKAIKMMAGAYSAEATQKKVEGLVVVCITVDAHGKVTNVSLVSGPPELVQSTIDAAKKWEFEPPAKAPVITKVETRYNLSGVCPDGSSDAGEITVEMRPDLEGGRTDVLKLLGSDFRPLPDYPELARSQRRRGQLYLSLVVNTDGSVTDVRVVKSLDELLDRLALEKVRTWRFNVSLGGKPTRLFLTLSYRIPCFNRQ